MKRICEVVRVVATVVHNSALGRKRSDMISDPQKLLRFGWEQPQIQTIEEMKSIVLGLGHMKGVKVTQDGEEVKFAEPEMRRTK